jgi:hypothetical protein
MEQIRCETKPGARLNLLGDQTRWGTKPESQVEVAALPGAPHRGKVAALPGLPVGGRCTPRGSPWEVDALLIASCWHGHTQKGFFSIQPKPTENGPSGPTNLAADNGSWSTKFGCGFEV